MMMSWGYKITIGFSAFVLLIGFLVYKAMNTEFDLVTKDYYKEELKYQDKLDAIKNANKISELAVELSNGNVVIRFPEEVKNLGITGEAWFYCKTNASNDRKFALTHLEDGKFSVPKSELRPERYYVKVSYKAGETTYYSEELIELL